MIRELTVADLDDFIAIRRESFARAPLSFAQLPDLEIDREQTKKDLAAKNEENFILGYFIDSKADGEQPILAGIMGMIRYDSPKRRHRGFLWGVYVREIARGRGAARKMLEETIARARHLEGFRRIILTVSNHSVGAIRLYESVGFVEFGREAGAAMNGETPMDEIHMYLDI